MIYSINKNDTDRSNIIIGVSEVPNYLRKGQLYKTLDEEDNEGFIVPATVMKREDFLKSKNDILHLLETVRFWLVEDVPDCLLDYILCPKRTSNFCNFVPKEWEIHFPVLKVLRIIQNTKIKF